MRRKRPQSRTNVELRARLLAERTNLALPASTKFERLSAQPSEVLLLSGKAQKLFTAHLAYRLPCEDVPYQYDAIHRLVVRFDIATKLNAALLKWALHKEAKAAKLATQAAPPQPGRGSDVGYQLSNRGGFQSYPDIFDPNPKVSDDDVEELVGRSAARLLHGIASRAVDAINGCDTPAKLKGAYGWLNINRPGHFNALHTHPKNRWSAVYYVDSGEPQLMTRRELTAASDKHDAACGSDVASHLIFRGGSTSGQGSRSYLALPPVPATLCLFPGSVPHCVMDSALRAGPEVRSERGQVSARRRADDAVDETGVDIQRGRHRVSIAMNFRDAAPPPPSIASVTLNGGQAELAA